MRDAVQKPWEAAVPVAVAARRRASESLDDDPHRPRLPSYPPVDPGDRHHDLYGSLSSRLGIRTVAEAAYEAHKKGVGLSAITPVWRVLDEHTPTTKKLSCGADFILKQRAREGL